jgi:hypothetical protein
MSLVFDEYGRPFVVLREQQTRGRVKGIEAHKVSLILTKTCFESPNLKSQTVLEIIFLSTT